MARKTSRQISKKTSSGAPSSGAGTSPSKGIVLRGGRIKDEPAKDSYGHKVKEGSGWAGEVVLEGLNADQKKEVLNLVRHTGSTGPRDANDRIMKIEDTKGTLRILTNENHLAVSIGKRVHRSHKGGKLTIVWSSDDLPVRVHWTAKEEKKSAKK